MLALTKIAYNQGLNYHRTWADQVNGPHTPRGPQAPPQTKIKKGLKWGKEREREREHVECKSFLVTFIKIKHICLGALFSASKTIKCIKLMEKILAG